MSTAFNPNVIKTLKIFSNEHAVPVFRWNFNAVLGFDDELRKHPPSKIAERNPEGKYSLHVATLFVIGEKLRVA